MPARPIIGPTSITVQPADQVATETYALDFPGSAEVTWSATATSTSGMDPADVTVSVSSPGNPATLTITLAVGTSIGPGGGSVSLDIAAHGPGNNDGNTTVTVTVPQGSVPCFVAGTRVLTPQGPVNVEDLRPGQRVCLAGGGDERVTWIGGRRIGRRELQATPALRPVRIARDAFGMGRPARTLRVSPQHRISVSDWRAQLYFGATSVLVAAQHLLDGKAVRRDASCDPVHYLHFALTSHRIVLAEGLEVETLFTGRMALAALDPAQRRELELIFGAAELDAACTLAPCLRAHEARLLTA